MTGADITGRLDAQMRAALAKQAALAPAPGGPYSKLPIEELRRNYREEHRYWNQDGPPLARGENTRLSGPVGDIPLRVYWPQVGKTLPGLVYLHGGGWILGDLDSHDKIMRILAQEAGVVVVGVDYRLAPEHKFPTQLQEAVAVADALDSRAGGLAAEWGIDTESLAIGGDSAGANLSAACCLERPGRFRAALLYYGAFGLRDSRSRRRFGGQGEGMSAEDLAFYKACLIRGPEDLHDPRIDIVSAAVERLPPAFIAAAELDPLLDDSLCLADLLADHGVLHEMRVYQGMLHGYLHLSRMVDTARRTLCDSAAWLNERLGGR